MVPTRYHAAANVGFEAQGGFSGAFLFSTADAMSSPSVNEWDVLLNTDDDPADDYARVGFDRDALLTGRFTGKSLITLVIDLDAQTIIKAYPAVSLYNSGFVGLVFLLSDVGLAPGVNEEFTYSAGISSLEGLGDDLIEQAASYNAFTQPVETAVFEQVEPGGPLVRLTLAVNREQLARTPVNGRLLFSPFNQGGERQALTVQLKR